MEENLVWFYTIPSLMSDGFLLISWLQSAPSEVRTMDIQQTSALQDEAIRRTLLYALVPIVVAFSFIVFVFYRARREASFKQKEAELKLSITEGEMKALRAQIDPHFIFNCLNSIHHYMQGNDATKAGDYLIKFSQLIRHVLESSEQRMVSLADELEANHIYIQLEQLRLNHSFDYVIACNPEINSDNIYIPPMLIQPFVENAIWHGTSDGGKVDLSIDTHDDKHIKCILKDNGKSKAEKSEVDLTHRVKKTSLGLALIEERLKTINQLYTSAASYTLSDRKDGISGRQVTLIIPYED